jgi:predicted DsbA family dithiol-disulfide isomerase
LLPSSMAVSSWCWRRSRRLSTCALQHQQHKTSLRLYWLPDSSALDLPLLQNQTQMSLSLSLSFSLRANFSSVDKFFSLHPTSECKKKIGVS